ncbi:MAG: hypothetical protein ACRES5_35435, partial [Pseudomonas sp.]
VGPLVDHYIQSIIGATEKRRESGAGVAVVTDMGDLESVRLGGGGVYQEWGLWGLGMSQGDLVGAGYCVDNITKK